MAMLMTSMLIATISLIVLSLLVISLMVWFPPTSTILVVDAMKQEHAEHQETQHVALVLKAVIYAEALVYIIVNVKLLSRWVSGQN